MGFLNSLFSGNVSNPTLLSALESYRQDASDDKLVDLWQKFLKSRVILAVPGEAAKSFAKIKQIREAIALPCQTVSKDNGDHLLVAFSDSQSFKQAMSESTESLTLTGDQAYQLVVGKGLFGLSVNANLPSHCELKVWQFQIFVEHVNDANKLHALATKLSRSANQADAESVMQAALLAAQREPGAQHPFSAELNVELARLQKVQGRLSEAEWTLKRALAIYEQLNMRELDVAATAEELGSMLCAAGKAESGAIYLQKALRLYEQVPGGKPESIARILCHLAGSDGNGIAGIDAEPLYTRACILLEERKSPELLSVLIKLGNLAEKGARPVEALAHYNRAIHAFDHIRRCHQLHLGQAAQAAASLQLAAGRLKEARALAERALPAFRKEGGDNDIENVELLLAKIEQAEKEIEASPAQASESRLESSAERRAAQRSSYFRSGKDPNDLPFLDTVMSATKTNKSAAAECASKPPDKPANGEEEALKQMCAFLDSLGPDGEQPAPADCGNGAVPAARLDENAIQEAVAATINSVVNGQSSGAENIQSEAFPSSDAQAAALEAAVQAADSQSASEHSISPPAAQVPEPPPAAVPFLPTAAFAASTSTAGDSAVAATTPTHTIANSPQLGRALAADISGVFSRSVMGGINRHERFDKSISERMKMGQAASADAMQPAEPARAQPDLDQQAPSAAADPTTESIEKRSAPPNTAQARAQPAVAAATQQPKLFESPVDSEISHIFSAAMFNAGAKSDRFDQPVETGPPASVTASASPPAPQTPPVSLAKAAPSAARTQQPTAPVAEDKTVRDDYEEVRAVAMLGQLRQRITSAKLQLTNAEMKMEAGEQQALLAKQPTVLTPAGAAPPDELARATTTAGAPHTVSKDGAAPSPSEMLYLINAKLQDNPHDCELLMRKGTLLARMERIDEAIKVFDKLTTLKPSDARVWHCKGTSLQFKTNFEDALYCFNHVLNLDSGHRKAMLRKAECLFHLGRLDQGLILYERLLALDPQFVSGWLSKARTLLKQGRFADALICYEQVLQIEPDNDTALKSKALVEAKLAAAG